MLGSRCSCLLALAALAVPAHAQPELEERFACQVPTLGQGGRQLHPLAVVGGLGVWLDEPGGLYTVDLRTGQPGPSIPLDRPVTNPQVEALGGTVALLRASASEQRFLLLDLAKGEILWERGPISSATGSWARLGDEVVISDGASCSRLSTTGVRWSVPYAGLAAEVAAERARMKTEVHADLTSAGQLLVAGERILVPLLGGGFLVLHAKDGRLERVLGGPSAGLNAPLEGGGLVEGRLYLIGHHPKDYQRFVVLPFDLDRMRPGKPLGVKPPARFAGSLQDIPGEPVRALLGGSVQNQPVAMILTPHRKKPRLTFVRMEARDQQPVASFAKRVVFRQRQRAALTGVDAAKGKVEWEQTVEGALHEEPLVQSDGLYYACARGDEPTYVVVHVDPASGEARDVGVWPSRILSFTRVADRALLLDAEGIVGVELSPDGLEPSWRCARPSPSRHQLAISDGSLYVRSGGGDAYVLQGYDLP
jgi:hypothetical protein